MFILAQMSVRIFIHRAITALLFNARRQAKYSLRFPDLRAPPKGYSKKEKSILLGSALNEQGGGAGLCFCSDGSAGGGLRGNAEPSSLFLRKAEFDLMRRFY